MKGVLEPTKGKLRWFLKETVVSNTKHIQTEYLEKVLVYDSKK